MLTLTVKKNELMAFLKIVWLMSTIFVLHYGFVKLPFENVTIIQIVWFVTICIVLLPVYGKEVVKAIFKIKYMRYLLLLMFFPLVYGLIGSIQLNQTVWEGMAAGRVFIWLFILMIMIVQIRNYQISNDNIIIALRNLSWLCLLAYIFIILFADLSISKTYDNTDLRGERLRFDATFIVYGFMYYYVQAITGKRTLLNLIFSSPFLGFLTFYLQSRSVLVALICSMAVVSLFFSDFMSKMRFVNLGVLIIPCLIVYFVLVNPDHKLALLFKYLIDFILYGYSEDTSSSYRAIEGAIALKSIEERPWFGVGLISYQSDAFSDAFGRVNIADVGILGIIMEYGYIGSIILLWQFIPIWRFLILYRIQGIVRTQKNTIQLLLLMNMYMFFMCLFTGMLAYAPLSVMLFNCLFIVAYSWMPNKKFQPKLI